MEPDNKHIDLSYLKQLSNGSNEFIAQMISIFMTQTPEAIELLYSYMQKKEWKLLKGVIHKMKPSFAFMGIKDMESVAILAEKHCETETHLDELPQLLLKIKTACELAMQELETAKQEFL